MSTATTDHPDLENAAICPRGCEANHNATWVHSVPVTSERWGSVEGLTLTTAHGHQIAYDATAEVSSCFFIKGPDGKEHPGGEFGDAEGGYVLIRFDIDGEPTSVVHVEPPAGWWPTQGQAPADLVERAAGYLATLRDKLRSIDAL